jgi:hypothetical protein
MNRRSLQNLQRGGGPGRGRGRLQRSITRAFVAHPFLSSTEIYDWAFARRPRARFSQACRWSVRRILIEVAEPVGRASTRGNPYLWKLKTEGS